MITVIQKNRAQIVVTKPVRTIVSLGARISPTVVTIDDIGQVINEQPAGMINGSNATFISAFLFIPESVAVYCNGVRLTLLDDYITTGNDTILLNESPVAGDHITIDYLKLN